MKAILATLTFGAFIWVLLEAGRTLKNAEGNNPQTKGINVISKGSTAVRSNESVTGSNESNETFVLSTGI